MMKIIRGTTLTVFLLAGAGMVVVSLPVLANVEAECRQEAEDYGIPPEQLEDYVTGCVLSRGGNYAQEPAPGESVVPDEGGEIPEPGMEGGEVPQ